LGTVEIYPTKGVERDGLLVDVGIGDVGVLGFRWCINFLDEFVNVKVETAEKFDFLDEVKIVEAKGDVLHNCW
jgi:hypothetical protein